MDQRHYPTAEEKFDGRPNVYTAEVDELLKNLTKAHGVEYAHELLLKDAVFRAEEEERKAARVKPTAKE